MSKLALLLAIFAMVAVPLVGCSSGDDDSADDDSGGDSDSDTDSDSDSDSDTDSDSDSDADGDFEDCAAGLQSGGTEEFPGDAGYVMYRWVDDAMTLLLQVEIYADYGAPSEPGTYDIDATEANYADCGLCIRVIEFEGETVLAQYMPIADSGTITLDEGYNLSSPVGTTFAGSFDVVMQEVEIAESTWQTTPVPDGCTGGLEASWSGTVTQAN